MLLIRIINEVLIFLVLFWMSILTILVYVLFLMLLDFEMGVIALHTKEIAELFAFARALRVYKETFLVQTRCACTCLYCCQKKLLVDLRRGWMGRGGGGVEVHVNCMFQISSWCHYYDLKLEIMKGYDINRINRR